MKKVLLILVLLCSSLLAQNTDKPSPYISDNQILNKVVANTTEALRVITVDTVTVEEGANSSFTTGNLSITTLATQLSSATAKKITITNFTEGGILYYGHSSGLTTSNGFPLWYGDTKTFTLSDLNKIYLIGSTTIDVRYDYEN